MSILTTRLYKPPLSERLVVRRQLIARLNEERDRPLKLVIAGAGYGKSILMSQWLDRCDCNYSWISLESDCNDPQVFLGYLVAGIRQKFPENMLRSEQLARSHQKLTGELLLQTLTNELQELPEPLILVFDDFHLVSNNVILTLFNQLIKFIPEGLQIAIVSRMDPPSNKSRLLAYQQVCEIRMADIRMNTDENSGTGRRLQMMVKYTL